ncbi:MAG: helix-turn-helix domain-containing protein [Fibrobacteres bacterium]|nr:helix-turn-helix domain-containing protein [Fibrobacterota bacterium]
METNEGFYTVNQLSELLQVPRSRIYNMVFRKVIPYCKLGRTVRFRKMDIAKVIESNYITAIHNI